MFLSQCAFSVAQQLVPTPADAEVSTVSTDTIRENAVQEGAVQEGAVQEGAVQEGAVPQEVAVESFHLPTEHHPWARFAPGAWREVQITTETFDEHGQVVNRSVTTQQEILKSVSDDRYELDVQATVDLVGKRIIGTWITRSLHNSTDGAGEIVATDRLDDANIQVGGRAIECQVWNVVYRDDGLLRTDRIHYTPAHFPFILERTTWSESGTDSALPVAGHVVTTIAMDVPYTLDGQVVRSSCIQTKRQGDKGSTNRIAFVTSQVPGGELVVRTSDFDPQGTLTRWSTQELLQSGEIPLDEPPESRRQQRRIRRQNRR